MTNRFPSTDTGSLGCSDSCSIKDSHLSAWHTVGINVKERERDGTGHSCGQGDHFLPAACSGCFCQCYISQHYTAEHRHHCYQWQTGEGSVCAWASGKLVYVGDIYNTHHSTTFPFFYRKRPFRPFLWRPAHPAMLGRCGRHWEGHRLTPFGCARTTSGSPTSESQPTSQWRYRIIYATHPSRWKPFKLSMYKASCYWCGSRHCTSDLFSM